MQNLQQSIHWPNQPESVHKVHRAHRIDKSNDPQSAYAQHILQNIHEYGTLTDTMSLLKHIHNPTKLIPYEQLYIQTFHHHGNFISEQSTSDANPLFQMTFDTT